MDNLKLIKQVVLQKSDLISEACCFAIDSLVGVIWIATPTALYSTSIANHEVEPIGCLHKTDSSRFVTHCDGLAAGSEIISLDSISSLESVCIAVNTGEVILLHTNPFELECVGSCDDGISCMSWSPDQELVLFLTSCNKLILMTVDFDIISEQLACQASFGEAEPINVGWGKKETQFHGSLGKAAAQNKQQVANLTSSLYDDGKPHVSWRGDGQYFACSTVDLNSGRRVVRVWSRDLTLHSTIETLDGIEHAICWRPCGNLIASVQRKPHRHDIVFFERNGLQHGSFILPFAKDEMKVRRLLWNNSSSVLGVWLEPLQPSCHVNHYVQLWTTSNYHWYLKSELRFTEPPEAVADVMWDPVSPLKLHLVTVGGHYVSYDFMWEVTQSEGCSHSNQGSIVLIDGRRLLYTAFRKCIIPPPMCSHELITPAAVAIVSFSPSLDQMLVMSSDGQATLYLLIQDKSGAKDKQDLKSCPKLLNTSKFPSHNSGLVLPRYLAWYQEEHLLGITWDIATQSDHLCQYHITYSKNDNHLLISKKVSFPCERPVIAIHNNATLVAIQLDDGSILRYSEEVGLLPWILKDGTSMQFAECCGHMELTTFNGQDVIVGLSETGKLYVNNIQLASNCSSFFVHDNFLLLTTHWHTCCCISLHQDASELKLLTNDNSGHEKFRNVERGSRIVTAISHDTRVVLQMPRGNLETIHPRALMLSHLRDLLDNMEFREAFVVMRKHRINMNLLYDHNPHLFLDNVAQFVQQLMIVGGLDLFLSELSNQDVTVTMYPGHHGLPHDTNMHQSCNKVDLVCDTILKCLDQSDGCLIPTITALVKKTTPQLETVLAKIKQLQASDGRGAGVDDALKHTLFLVDVNQLYDVALGMYDFDLVLMVAEKSQKDPKEYLPFLNKLRKMDIHYQKYSIDCYLQRYTNALRHLSHYSSDDKFEEALSLIKAHDLYSLGLELYSGRQEPYKAIANAFGSHLVDKKRFKEAVLMFRRAQDLPAALSACEGWGCWQQAFVLSAELHQSEKQRVALAHRMADKLRQQRHHKEAARVLLEYAGDVEEAIVVLVEGGAWADALCMAHQRGRADLILTHIQPAVLEAQQGHMSSVDTLETNFNRFLTRLAIVRETRDVNARILADGRVLEEKEDDLFSEASSVAGSMLSSSSAVHSRSTAHSKKNRRKADKKKFSLKEGSPYEEMALVSALADITTTVDNMQSDVGELLTVLVQFSHDQLARQLQQVFTQLLNMVKEQVNTIWLPSLHATQVPPVTGPWSTVNSIVSAAADSEAKRDELPPVPSIKPLLWRIDFLS